MMRSFCTYFDHRYLSRGLALEGSLRAHCASFRLWVLCLTDQCYDILARLELPNVRMIRMSDLERGDDRLLAAKGNRSVVEYYFTCTPTLLRYIFDNEPDVDLLTYLDADLYFFDSPEPLFEEIGEASVAIIPHGHARDAHEWERRFGIYNVGWVTFRRSLSGRGCLEWWRDRCLEWCYDREEPTRFADQKYLDEWPIRFTGVHIVRHKGANVASWNVMKYRIHKIGGQVLVDEVPLIFYHFHHLKERKKWLFETSFGSYGVILNKTLKKQVFSIYLQCLATNQAKCDRYSEKLGEVAIIRNSLRDTFDLFSVEFVRKILTRQAILFLRKSVL